jgi:hypothetical protein
VSEYINGTTDILGGSVIRYALNTTTPNQAVITKIVAGNGITISSTGVDPGTGDVTISIDVSGTGGGGSNGETGGEGTGGGGVATAVGTVTAVNMTAPQGMYVTGAPVTTGGTISLRLSSGYIIPLYTDIQQGKTAFSWGDHALVGYLTPVTFISDYDSDIIGARNSSNKVYTLTNDYQAGSTKVYVNGVRYSPGVGNDYTESAANQITFTNAPDSGDLILVDYIKS